MKNNKFKKKFVIGSANFFQKYGADQNKVSNNEIKNILSLAKENKIFKIDTVENYFKNKNIFKNR